MTSGSSEVRSVPGFELLPKNVEKLTPENVFTGREYLFEQGESFFNLFIFS